MKLLTIALMLTMAACGAKDKSKRTAPAPEAPKVEEIAGAKAPDATREPAVPTPEGVATGTPEALAPAAAQPTVPLAALEEGAAVLPPPAVPSMVSSCTIRLKMVGKSVKGCLQFPNGGEFAARCSTQINRKPCAKTTKKAVCRFGENATEFVKPKDVTLQDIEADCTARYGTYAAPAKASTATPDAAGDQDQDD